MVIRSVFQSLACNEFAYVFVNPMNFNFFDFFPMFPLPQVFLPAYNAAFKRGVQAVVASRSQSAQKRD